MTKTYILQKNIESPMGCVAAGTESVFDGGFYCFPYIGRKYNDDNNGWLGNSFMTSDPSSMPEWFIEKKEEPKSNDSFQWTDELVKEYAANWLEAANKNENYISVESFKRYHSGNEVCGVDINWVVKYCKGDLSKVMKAEDCRFIGSREECHDFVKKYKPQADNKPDWWIVEYGDESGRHTAPLWECQEKKCPIRKVKRLSDGEVFSVGDVIEFGIGDIKNANIEKFEIDYFDKNEITAYHKYAGRTIKGWKKVYPPQPQKEEQGIKQVNDKFYTWMGEELIPIKKVDAMCEDAFNAARKEESILKSGSHNHLPPFYAKYSTFQDYKNSKQ